MTKEIYKDDKGEFILRGATDKDLQRLAPVFVVKEYITKPKKIDWSKVADGTIVKYNSDSATPFVFSKNWMSTVDNDMHDMVFDTAHWHAWRGGDCPLPEGVMVEVEFRVHWESKLGHPLATRKVWTYHDRPRDDQIIAYRITGLAEGWEY